MRRSLGKDAILERVKTLTLPIPGLKGYYFGSSGVGTAGLLAGKRFSLIYPGLTAAPRSAHSENVFSSDRSLTSSPRQPTFHAEAALHFHSLTPSCFVFITALVTIWNYLLLRV